MSTTHSACPGIWTKTPNGIPKEKYDSESSDEEPQVRMRVGEMYQAKVPSWQECKDSKQVNAKEGMLIWSPNDVLIDEKLNQYCQTAKDKHYYNMEQALGMLFWHKHDIKKSLSDMQNFTPMPDEWSMEDKVLFEQAYTFHGKNFRKIQQLIPDKEIGQLVKHYYTWKKSRVKTSLMDKQATKRQHEDSEDSGHEGDGLIEIDEHKAPPLKLHIAEDGVDVKHKLPKGIHLSNDDINTLAMHVKGAEGHLCALDDELVTVKRQVQTEKQECGKLSANLTEILQPDDIKLSEDEAWSEDELSLAVEGVRKFGENCEAISQILATKNPEQVKGFFTTYRTRLNLEMVLKEHQDNKVACKLVKMDVTD